jgi:hypothetical protein
MNEIVAYEVMGVSATPSLPLDCMAISDEPPEDTHIRPQRLCLALTLHIISRLFVESCSELRSSPSELGSVKSHAYVFLRCFRALGGECCLALMVSESVRFSLTSSDKQFAIWTLREAIVSTYQSDPIVAQSLLRWLVWLLSCPASSISSPSNFKIGSLENVIIDRDTYLQGQVDGITYAIPPSGRPVLTCQIRIFLIQELRMLLGGDDWIPVWASVSAHVIQNKLCIIERSVIPSDTPKQATGNFIAIIIYIDSYIELDTLRFRIPLSKKQIQSHLCQLAVVEILLSVLCGELASPLAKHALVQNNKTSSVAAVEVEDAHALEWWSALAALSCVVVSNDTAKDSLDACYGIVPFARLLTPCIEYSAMSEKGVASALASLLIELNVRGGRWFAPMPPFAGWTKLPTLSSTTCQSGFVDKLMSPVSQWGSSNLQYPSISDLSPLYYARTDMVLNVSKCVSPIKMYQSSPPPGDSANPGRFMRSTSGSQGGGFVGFDGRVRQDSSVNADPLVEYGDDTSTGRGSFSVHSVRGFPHAYSLSAFPTPPPSVAGGDKNGDDVSVFMGKMGKSANAGDIRLDYSGEYIPLIAGLNWGLAHMDSVLLGVVYEFMLQQREFSTESSRSKAGAVLEGFDDMMLHRESDPLLMSLRQHSVQQYLHSYIVSGSQTPASHWEPQYSRLRICSMDSAELLFSLAIVLPSDLQLILLNALSHIIDGNRSNIILLSTKSFVARVSRILFSNDCISRGPFCHILSQLLRQQISKDTLHVLVSRAQSVYGVNVRDIIIGDPYLPAKGAKRCVVDSDNIDIDDTGCQILYMLGVAVENPEPAAFWHFDQASPFTSGIQLPPMDRVPPASVGFSIVTWIRTGGLGNVPISVLMQHTVQCLDHSTSNGNEFSMIVFFRIVYRTGINSKEHDNASVASAGLPDNQPDDVLKKRILQLCISYRRSRSPSYECVEGSSEDSIIGLNGDIITSFVGFSTPDVIIDYDWSEMASWHLLALSFSSSGVSCIIDSNAVPVLYWTALGYANLDGDLDSLEKKELQLPPNVKYPTVQKDQYFCGCLGGIFYEHDFFLKASDRLSEASCSSSVSSKTVQNKILREFEFLQCYTETIKGFTGSVGTYHLVEGVVDSGTLCSVFQAGVVSGLPLLPSNRKLFALVAEEGTYQHVIRPETVDRSDKPPLLDSQIGMHGDPASDRGRLASRRSSEQLQGGATVIFGTNRRMSRSMSPISVSRAMDNATAGVGSHDEMSLNRARLDGTYIADARPVATANQQQSTSLVSDLLTMFSGPSKEGDKYPVDQVSLIHGSVNICETSSISSVISQMGGMALWYPLLVIDRPHQVII